MSNFYSTNIYQFTILLTFLIFLGCEKENSNNIVEPPQPKTYAVTVTNNLTNFHYGNIEVKIDGRRFPTITPGQSHTVTGISEGVHSISANGTGFINISANIPVYDDFHACIEGGQNIQDFPRWVACP